jgi:hypothetical protein
MRLLLTFCVVCISLLVAQPRQPDIAAQKAAMKKLEFLAGKWEGDAKVWRGPGEPIAVRQTEDVRMRLDGLVLLVEGTGRDPQSGKAVFNALATIAFDEVSGTYRTRAYHDGRYLDTELSVVDKGYSWGYEAGPAKIRNTMRLSPEGEWVQTGEVLFGNAPPRKTMEMTLRRTQ